MTWDQMYSGTVGALYDLIAGSSYVVASFIEIRSSTPSRFSSQLLNLGH